MPTPIYVTTELAVIDDAGIILHSSTVGSYSCRDEWLGDLGSELREELHRKPDYLQYDEVDMFLLCQSVLPKMRGMCKVSVQLLSTTTKEEALKIAGSIADRYAQYNPLSLYKLDTEPNEFMQDADDVIVFLGNEWCIAEAWWFMLIERLRHDVGGVDVLSILRKSHQYDEDQWYDEDDKEDHITLWLNGVRDEPNPLAWLSMESGPLLTAYQLEKNKEVAA